MTIPVNPAVFGFGYHVAPYSGWPVANYPPAATQVGPLVRFSTPAVRLPWGAAEPNPWWSWGRVPVVSPLPGPVAMPVEVGGTPARRRGRP